MSGYFGALMRSSGMAFASRAPAIAPVEPPVLEAAVERRPAAMLASTTATAVTPQAHVTPIAVLNAEPVRSAPLAADPAAPGLQAEFAGAEHAHPTVAPYAAADSPAVPAARPVETSKRDLGQALINAAVRWVTADIPHVGGVAQVVPQRGQSLPPESRPDTMTPALREDAPDWALTRSDVAAARTPARGLASESKRPQEGQTRFTRPTPTTVQGPVAPLDRGDGVEVSIGAIHVRVDAPAVHTVDTPAPAPPAAAATTRGALSRRALRRI